MAGLAWEMVDAILVSTSVSGAVVDCWAVPPLRISLNDLDPENTKMLTAISHTRSVTRSWLRVLFSEEAQHKAASEEIALYLTVPDRNFSDQSSNLPATALF